MGSVVIVDAAGAMVEILAEVVAWQFSDIRRTLMAADGMDAYEVERMFIVDARNATPPSQLQELIDQFDAQKSFSLDNSDYLSEIVFYAARTAILVSCNYWEFQKVEFIDGADLSAIEREYPQNIKKNIDKEISHIMEIQDKIKSEEGSKDQTKKLLREVVNRAVAPEFQRLDLKITENTEITKRIETDHGNKLDAILKNLGIDQ